MSYDHSVLLIKFRNTPEGRDTGYQNKEVEAPCESFGKY